MCSFYAVVSTPIEQRKLVVDYVPVEHRLFHSIECATGSYTVTAFSENARFQWLRRYIRAGKAAGFLETLYQDVIKCTGNKRGPSYHINK